MEHQILRFFIHDISLYASVTNCVQIYIMRTRRILSSKETAVQNSYKTDRLAQIEGREQKIGELSVIQKNQLAYYKGTKLPDCELLY